MAAHRAQPGRRYLTPSGLPVQVVEANGDQIVLQSLASDNRFAVPAGYPLRPFTGKENAACEVRSHPYTPYIRPRHARTEPKLLASVIDALLLEGGLTMRGLVREIRRMASASCHGKDVGANVRARTYWLQKRGMQLNRDHKGRVYIR